MGARSCRSPSSDPRDVGTRQVDEQGTGRTAKSSPTFRRIDGVDGVGGDGVQDTDAFHVVGRQFSGRLSRLIVVDADTVIGRGADSLDASETVPAHGTGLRISLDSEEVRLLGILEDEGLTTVLVTGMTDAHAAALCRDAGLHPLILSDRSLQQGSLAACSLGAARADALAGLCVARSLSLRDACVIAARPLDLEMMLGSGLALALEDAGYEACAAADEVFPARGQGGLAQALAFLVDELCVDRSD